jgi:hypothetical protein
VFVRQLSSSGSLIFALTAGVSHSDDQRESLFLSEAEGKNPCKSLCCRRFLPSISQRDLQEKLS